MRSRRMRFVSRSLRCELKTKRKKLVRHVARRNGRGEAILRANSAVRFDGAMKRRLVASVREWQVARCGD